MHAQQITQMVSMTARHLLGVYGVDSLDPPSVLLLGSGTLVDLGGIPAILTAGHVGRERDRYVRLARRGLDDDGEIIPGPHYLIEDPADLAILEVGPEPALAPGQEILSLSRLAASSPNTGENDLFIHGFPGDLSRSSAFLPGRESESLPLETFEQACTSALFDPRFHFAVNYPDPLALRTNVGGGTVSIPDPHGLSGSAVWRANTTLGAPWRPDLAEVVGVAQMWLKDENVIVATRVEVVREILLTVLRKRHAYFRWVSRGRPIGDDLADWYDAVVTFPAL